MLDSALQTIALAWLEATTAPKRNKVAKQLAEFPRRTKEYNCAHAMASNDTARVTCYSIPYGEARKAMWAEIKAGEKTKAKPSAKKVAKAAKPSAPIDEVEMLTKIATEAAIAAVSAYLKK